MSEDTSKQFLWSTPSFNTKEEESKNKFFAKNNIMINNIDDIFNNLNSPPNENTETI